MPFIAAIKAHCPKALSVLKSIRAFLFAVMEKAALGNEQKGAFATNVDPLPFDPTTSAIPVSYPIKTLEELEARTYFDSFHFPFNQAAVKLPSDSGLPQRPRILVCHDLAGGYTCDRFVQGGRNADAYAIWHWYLFDVFVYFSHSLVTLPPPCWTNAAHRHGVKVLGTFIMEWDEGKANASKLLMTKDFVHMYASRLTELAVSLGFDGWLLNFEVSLDRDQIQNLKEFVSCLTKSMHSSITGSLVIWYDSVTVDGDLSWQNQLNDKNEPFFALCDGIFMNYSWKEDFPKKSADVAGERKFDVYMGIDVFGRGTYGGGQWTTNAALDVIKKADVSAAIFAPGWVYETKQPPNFQTAENRWWSLVEKSWGTSQRYPKMLPFYSNFDQGCGYHTCNNGEQISEIPWNNISLQTFQPFLEHLESSDTPIRVSVDLNEASYNGGGNITFRGALDDGAAFSTRLFLGELPVGSRPIKFTFSVKASVNSQLGLALKFSSSSPTNKSVLLAVPGATFLTVNQLSDTYTAVIIPRVMKLETQSGWVVQEATVDDMAGHLLEEIQALSYRLMPTGSHRKDPAEPSEYNAILGDLRISLGEDNLSFPSAGSWLVDASSVSWASGPAGSTVLSLELCWQLEVGEAEAFPRYSVYVDREASDGNEEYIGAAVVNSFYVSELPVPAGTRSIKFLVQVWGVDGVCQSLQESPFLLVHVPDL